MYSAKTLGIKINFNKCRGLSYDAKRLLKVLHRRADGISRAEVYEWYGAAVNELLERKLAFWSDADFSTYDSLEFEFDYWG